MPEKTFREVLSRNSKLTLCFQEIEHRAFNSWIPLLTQEHGSHAGATHLRNVERNADRMVPAAEKEKFTDGEIFLLLSAILLHDLGKIAPEDWPLCPPEENSTGELKRRWEHNCASKRLIGEHWAELGFPDERIAGYCGLLAYAHGLKQPLNRWRSCLCDANCPLDGPKRHEYRVTSLDGYGELRIPLLAAILRIADETQNQFSRAVSNEIYEMFRKSEKRSIGKAFRRYIEDVEFNQRGRCVILHIPQVGDDARGPGVLAVSGLASVIEKSVEAIDYWHEDLAPIGVEYDYVWVEHGGRLFSGGRALDKSQEDWVKDPRWAVFQKFLEALEREIEKYGNGLLETTYQELEAIMDAPLKEHDRWLIERIGSEQSMVQIRAEGDSLRIRLEDETHITGNFDRLKEALHLADESPEEARQQRKDLDEQIQQALLALHRRTGGYQLFTWAELEKTLGFRLNNTNRARVLKMNFSDKTRKGAKYMLTRTERDGEFRIQREEEDGAVTGDALVEFIEQLYKKTGIESGSDWRFTWREIEAAYREQGGNLNGKQRDELRNNPKIREMVEDWQDR